MRKFQQWVRTNAAVIAAASALAALGGPGIRDIATTIGAVAETLATQPSVADEEGKSDGIR